MLGAVFTPGKYKEKKNKRYGHRGVSEGEWFLGSGEILRPEIKLETE